MSSRSYQQKARDREIQLAFRAECSGIPIKLIDLPRVEAEGRRLWATGATDQVTLRAGLAAFVAQLTEGYST